MKARYTQNVFKHIYEAILQQKTNFTASTRLRYFVAHSI